MSDTNTKKNSADQAKTFLLGNLITACVNQLKTMDSPFNSLSEAQQKAVIDSIKEDVLGTVKKAVKIIAADQRVSFVADVESVKFKDGVQVVLKAGTSEHAHLLADRAGESVLIVLDGTEDIFESVEGIPVAESDQKSLKSV